MTNRATWHQMQRTRLSFLCQSGSFKSFCKAGDQNVKMGQRIILEAWCLFIQSVKASDLLFLFLPNLSWKHYISHYLCPHSSFIQTPPFLPFHVSAQLVLVPLYDVSHHYTHILYRNGWPSRLMNAGSRFWLVLCRNKQKPIHRRINCQLLLVFVHASYHWGPNWIHNLLLFAYNYTYSDILINIWLNFFFFFA